MRRCRRADLARSPHGPPPTGVLVLAVTVAAVLALAACTTTLSREELATEYYNIGSAYFDLGELEKSATYLSRAIELSPQLARGSYNLARVYVLQERYDDALALLDRLLAEDPENSLVIETIAYAHYEAGDLAQAAEWYARAERTNPADPQLLRNRAAVELELGDAEAALAALRRALELDADDPALALELARAERLAGNATASLDAYERHVELADSPGADALLEYAALLEEEEYYADAIEVLAGAPDAAGTQPTQQALAHFERGRLLLTEAQETEGGIDAVRTAISLGFDDAEAFASLLANPDLVGRAELEELGGDAGLVEGAGTNAEPEAADPPDDGEPDALDEEASDGGQVDEASPAAEDG